MRALRIVNVRTGFELGDRIRVADRFWTRLLGLFGRREPKSGEGLLIVPSRGVHMYGMRYALDVLLLDATGTVLACYPDLSPGERTPLHPRVHLALELPVGRIGLSGTREGDRLRREAVGEADGALRRPAVVL